MLSLRPVVSPRWALAATALVAVAAFGARSPAEDLSPALARLRADVTFLADDAREGRGPGTPGIDAAADYIATVFKEAGLKPPAGGNGYFQPFTINGDSKLGDAQELAATKGGEAVEKGQFKDDFTPLSIGSGGDLKDVPVVFAGYGITAKDEKEGLDYDDYAGLDVKGKAVLLLRRAPTLGKEDGPFANKGNTPSRFATFVHKATNAFQHGAAAVLLVNDLEGLKGGKDELIGFRSAGGERYSNIPFVMLTRAFGDKLLAASGSPSLEELEKRINADLKPQGRELEGLKLDAKLDLQRTEIQAKNVVGVIEGAGPQSEETVVVGAHYDHLGRGGFGSLSPFSRDIHNGADDNASGTAMVLEMARRLGRRLDPLPRRVVLIAFSGEERGLLGSSHYVKNPLYPLEKTTFMVNFDMVGRLNDKDELTVYGTGSTPGLDNLVDALGSSEGFKVKKIADSSGDSDHYSFYQKDIPIAFLFTGTHRDYHRPSDDVENVNFPGMARIADFGELLLLDLIRRPTRPEFTKVARAPRTDPGRGGVSAYLGSIPDYDDEGKGVKLSGVREDSPAEKGGLKGGDTIIGFGGKPVGTIYDYTESLGRYKPGDEVEVVVMRDGKETKLKVTLGARPRESGH
jgi:hypothetical protein